MFVIKFNEEVTGDKIVVNTTTENCLKILIIDKSSVKRALIMVNFLHMLLYFTK